MNSNPNYLNNYQAKDLQHSALAYLWDDDQAQLPDVENTLYAATIEAWKEYIPPSPVVYHPTIPLCGRSSFATSKIPNRPSPVAGLELVSAHCAHSLSTRSRTLY
jgi:hypothetical protein